MTTLQTAAGGTAGELGLEALEGVGVVRYSPRERATPPVGVGHHTDGSG